MVSLLYSIFWIVASIWLVKWEQWKQYYPTALFTMVANLTYEVIFAEYLLWAMEPNGLPNVTLNILLLSLIGMPLSTMIYLSNFPFEKSRWKQVGYISLFVLGFTVMEYVSMLLGAITHHHGWTLFGSFLFDIAMFSIILIHFSRPLLAWALSFAVLFVMAWLFGLDFSKMR